MIANPDKLRPSILDAYISGKVRDQFKIIEQKATPFDGLYILILENEKGDHFSRMTRPGPFTQRIKDYMFANKLATPVGMILQIRENENKLRFFEVVKHI